MNEPKMRFPELIKDRNITYEWALQAKNEQLKRQLFQSTITVDKAKRDIKNIKAEIARWNHY